MARLDVQFGDMVDTCINTMLRAVARSSRAMTVLARVNGNDGWYQTSIPVGARL
jgi:hypothetical protein